jgi:hypothetical protein
MNKILFFSFHYFQILYVIIFEILSIITGCLCIFLLIFCYNTQKKVKFILKDILPISLLKNKNINLLKTYKPQTGDIYLGQWSSSFPLCMFDTVKYYPTHVGFIWNRKKTLDGEPCALLEDENETETYIIEINHFRKEKNCLKSTLHLKKGLRVMRMKPFFSDMNGILYIRKIKNEIDSQKIEKVLLQSCSDITFDPRISTMTIDSTVGVGWKPVYPFISDLFMYKLKFYEKKYKKKQFFCSEFLAWFLEILNCVKVPNERYFQMSPACFLSSTLSLEQIAVQNSWSTEFVIKKNF